MMEINIHSQTPVTAPERNLIKGLVGEYKDTLSPESASVGFNQALRQHFNQRVMRVQVESVKGDLKVNIHLDKGKSLYQTAFWI